MRIRRLLPVLISGVIGTLILIGFYQPNIVSSGLLQVAQIVTAGGVLLGVGNLLAIHLKRIRKVPAGRFNSIILILGVVLAFSLQLVADLQGGSLLVLASEVFLYVYQPLAGSILALLTFFALRAAWQAMQVRPADAVIIVLVGALFLLAGGPWAAAIPGLQGALEWTRAYPILGIARGLLLGIGLGATIASVRVLLGFDEPYFDR